MSEDGVNAFRLVLVPLPDERPPLVRLRAALKTLLRRYRLRCEAVEELTNSGSSAPLNFGRSPVGPERDEEKP